MLISISELKEKFAINVSGILHIGAHNCEELNDYLRFGLAISDIYWIEALPKLVEKNKHANPLLNIYQAVIYDEDNKEVEFNISKADDDINNHQSSSILQFGSHKTSHPQVKLLESVKMKTSRVDSVINKYNIDMRNVNFVNLDIQGVELRALKSMEGYLKNIDYIYTEVNIEEVYKECDQMSDLTEFLTRHNFSLADARIYRQYGWGDAFYIKNKK